MTTVTVLFVFPLFFLVGEVWGIKPSSGYCIGNGCFALFRDPSDFRTAQSHCRNQGGHLMTVRTSVSNDVLFVLLGNLTGSVWIGLHRLSGCPDPDPAAGLRGFQWVTKDTESDFTNWRPKFNSSCSSHSCVSVNGKDGFKWGQTPCGRTEAGFLCEYTFSEPCQSLTVGPEESVLYMTPYGFEVDDLQSVPLGSTATLIPSETKYICFLEKWLQAPWKCEVNEGGCEYKCAVDPNNVPFCYCPPGQTVSPANNVSCDTQGTDDPCAPLGCQQLCYADGTCGCEHGLKLAEDGRSCVDFNECADERQCPGENSRCINTQLGFKCVCKDGYRLSRGQCVDKDECVFAPCEHMCVNTPGSYTCACYKGYKVDKNWPNKCKLYCGREECPAVCDPNDKRQCSCPDGYVAEERQEGTFCLEIDECAFSYCDQGCKNTFGSYVCYCDAGYKLVKEYKCVKSDEETEGSELVTSPSLPTSPLVPTGRPSAVTPGGLVGIIVCTVFLILLVVFASHMVLSRRGGKKASASAGLKAAEEEAHSLHGVPSDSNTDKIRKVKRQLERLNGNKAAGPDGVHPESRGLVQIS